MTDNLNKDIKAIVAKLKRNSITVERFEIKQQCLNLCDYQDNERLSAKNRDSIYDYFVSQQSSITVSGNGSMIPGQTKGEIINGVVEQLTATGVENSQESVLTLLESLEFQHQEISEAITFVYDQYKLRLEQSITSTVSNTNAEMASMFNSLNAKLTQSNQQLTAKMEELKARARSWNE